MAVFSDILQTIELFRQWRVQLKEKKRLITLRNLPREEMQIKDKRVIVTGAASDLGFAFCRELLRNGASVRYI